MSLPAEIWARIFYFAADSDILFLPGLLPSLAESVWYKDYSKSYLCGGDPAFEWILWSPEQSMDSLQRTSYATKKAIISTCRQWRQMGLESLFQCLYFSHAMKVVALAAMLDSTSALATPTSSYGWWTKRIHIGPYLYPGCNASSIEEFQENLISIIRHCPNVQIFIVERPLGSSSWPIIDALARYASCKLHTIFVNIPGQSVSQIVWALNALPSIVTAHIGFQNSPTEETALPESAADLELRSPCLRQISLRGFVGTLLEQLEQWDLPSLRSFSMDDSSSIRDPQDVVEFFKGHGWCLVYLDLNLKNFVDVALILDLCLNLRTFAFNADWRITPHDEVTSKIVNRPHQHITTIGLHGLSFAFGVGARYLLAMANNLFEPHHVTHWNDLNMAALNKRNFPNLNRIRVVNRGILEDLNKVNGPSEESGGYDRWSKWVTMCADAGIRLEDCTGQLLGMC